MIFHNFFSVFEPSQNIQSILFSLFVTQSFTLLKLWDCKTSMHLDTLYLLQYLLAHFPHKKKFVAIFLHTQDTKKLQKNRPSFQKTEKSKKCFIFLFPTYNHYSEPGSHSNSKCYCFLLLVPLPSERASHSILFLGKHTNVIGMSFFYIIWEHPQE